MIDLASILIIITALINAFLGIWVYRKRRKNASIFWFSTFVFSLVLWCIAILVTHLTRVPEQAIIWGRLIYGSGLLIATTLFVFANVFPHADCRLSREFKLATFVPTGVLFALTVFTGSVIEEAQIPLKGEAMARFGPIYPVYLLVMIVLLGVALYLLFRTYRQSKDVTKAQLLYVLLGILFTVLVGGTANLILPTFGYFELWAVMGPTSSLFVIFFVVYAILKHHLLGIRVVSIEILAFLIVASFLTDVLLSQSLVEFLLRVPLLALIILFAYLLIRGVFKELEGSGKIRKQAQKIQQQAQKLQRANAKLRKLDKLKTLFLSIASHQLRTPLTGIKGFVSMIISGDFGTVPDKIKDILNEIHANVNRLIRLVNTFLNISRIESGRLTVIKEKHDLIPLVKKIVAELSFTAQDKNVKLSVSNQVDSLVAKVDADKIEDVLINLVDNAIKYTPEGGTVTVKLMDLGSKVKFEVKDTGQGLKPAEIDAVFRKFVRGSSAKMNSEGSGLGLYIAKQVVDRHQGQIGVASPGIGKGSTFWVEIPKK